MMTVFQAEIRKLLIWSKIVGLLHCSYTFEAGLLTRDKNDLTYYSCLEFMRTLAMLVCTYSIHEKGFHFMQHYFLIKYWLIIITARISETLIVKFINDIIAFDRKQLMLLRPTLLVHSCSSKNLMTWNRTLTVLFVYVLIYHMTRWYFMPPKTNDFSTITFYLFLDPNMVDMVVVNGACIYIHSVASRFCSLNDGWKRLPSGLVATSGEWTQSEITMSIESIRLLHADLCEIINVFSLGYGMVMLGYFTLSFISLLMFTYLYFAIGYPISDTSSIGIIGWCLPLFIRYSQYGIFHISILVNSSFANEKKNKIISYLRLCQISKLPTHTKLQIKLFMSQMPEFESNEMTAYGIFNINLHLVLTNLILLFSGLITLIQMKNHPFISRLSKVVMIHVKNNYSKNYTHT